MSNKDLLYKEWKKKKKKEVMFRMNKKNDIELEKRVVKNNLKLYLTF